MRKSLWIMLAVMVVAVGAPNAHADTFTYSYTDTSNGISWITAAIPAVTMPTTVPAADLTATSNTGNLAGCVTTSVVLDDAAGGGGSTQTTIAAMCSGNTHPFGIVSLDGFSLTDYSTPGTYVSPLISSDTLVVTAASVGTPEPSSVALMLLGVGLVFVLRKRNSRDHQLAT